MYRSSSSRNLCGSSANACPVGDLRNRESSECRAPRTTALSVMSIPYRLKSCSSTVRRRNWPTSSARLGRSRKSPSTCHGSDDHSAEPGGAHRRRFFQALARLGPAGIDKRAESAPIVHCAIRLPSLPIADRTSRFVDAHGPVSEGRPTGNHVLLGGRSSAGPSSGSGEATFRACDCPGGLYFPPQIKRCGGFTVKVIRSSAVPR